MLGEPPPALLRYLQLTATPADAPETARAADPDLRNHHG
jgi:hypothetical protein